MSTGSIQKILIANRGEIAVRIIRSCRELGIRTVAVYSEPDRRSPHVRMADEAYAIGPAPSRQSYLDGARIIDVATYTGADAIHPGYGFLSENADFASACGDAGVIFIGPPPEAIRAMGDKLGAKRLMAAAGVPMAPGTTDPVADAQHGLAVAEEIGFPVLVKAAAGGGGKGMRIVERAEDFRSAFDMARSEARSAFGDDRVFLEKYITEPRHIEFQILADARRDVIHLFERECSIQRRHQKVVEEAPSSVLTESKRREMGHAAVEAARACGYVNAGTVEFLYDAGGNFYFMEMNTRLQVEHPVTEWITGIDLVAEQIHIAAGGGLRFRQDDVAIRGHAIECRIYAEDPANRFMPDPGMIVRHAPPSGFGVRVDSGVDEGSRIEIHYDPLVSKLTTWGRTREEAIDRMRRALTEYEIAGVRTTLPFCRFVMDHAQFRAGAYSTHFVDRHFTPESNSPAPDHMNDGSDVAAALAAALVHSRRQSSPPASTATDATRWHSRRELR